MFCYTVDVAAIAKIFGKEIERDNVKYMEANRLLVDFKLRNSRFKVRDTVNHGSVIGKNPFYFNISMSNYSNFKYLCLFPV